MSAPRTPRGSSRTNATGAAMVAATDVVVEAESAEAKRIAEAVTPNTAAGAAVVAATEVAAEAQAAETMAAAEAVAAVVAPAGPVAGTPETAAFAAVAAAQLAGSALASGDPLPPVSEADFDDDFDLLSGALTVEQVAEALRRAREVDPAHIALLRDALAILDREADPTVPPNGIDRMRREALGMSAVQDAPATGETRLFRLVSAIVGDDGPVEAGKWVAIDQDYHATLRRGLSIDVDWDAGLPQ